MKKELIAFLKIVSIVFILGIVFYACSKTDDPPADPCLGITITVTATTANTDAGASTGGIVATASGGSGSSTFSIDGKPFQSSGTFTGLPKGPHTVIAKDSKGCTGTGTFTVNETDPCTGVTLTISATATDSDPCAPGGIITATGAGSTNLTYSVDAGLFQASNIFNNISSGNHTVNVKNGTGCVKNTSITVNPLSAGALFIAARTIIQNNCAVATCHTGGSPAGGINFSVDCNIVLNKERVKARAIDGTPSIMPPTGALPQADRDKITAWINAGGRFTD